MTVKYHYLQYTISQNVQQQIDLHVKVPTSALNNHILLHNIINMFLFFPVENISKPQNFSVANVTSRSITITWLAPKDGESAVTNYSLYYSHDNITYARTLANTHIYTILDLSK